VDMDKASSHDSLFDEDEDADADAVAEGDSIAPLNDVTNTATNTAAATPTSVVPSASARPQSLALALPGISRANSAGSTAGPSAAPNRNGTGAGPGVSALAQQAPRTGAASGIPVLSPAIYRQFSDDVLLYSSMDGQVVLVDRRVPSYEGTSGGVGRLLPGERAPPWCMSVSGHLERGEDVPPIPSPHPLVTVTCVTYPAAQSHA
jgi:transcriptional activator SPT8